MANNNTDHMGFTKWEIANFRRAYAANKMNYKKMDSLSAKIETLGKELDTVLVQSEAWEAPVKTATQAKLGVALTAREVMYYHDNPEKWAERQASGSDAPVNDAPIPTEEPLPEMGVPEEEDPTV